MESETTKQHQHESSNNITCGIITLSDSRDKKEDLSGDYIENKLKKRYTVKSREIIKDEKEDLLKSIDEMINNNVDVILTNGGTGLSERDITVESVEKIFDKKIDGFGEIFRHQSYIEIGSGALLSRATAGVYKKCCIFSMPGSPNAVKTALNIIIDELPHIVHHAKK